MWGYEQVGSTRNNGDRVFGVYSLRSAELMEAGTPTVSSLLRKTITPAVASVRVGDLLPVIFDGRVWSVMRDGVLVGHLTWSAVSKGEPDPRTGTPMWDLDDGTLHVERVVVDTAGEVVNLGGFVTPL